MSITDIQRRILAIEAASDDPERAHQMEDDLHFDVLCAIAGGAPNPMALATAVLESSELDFPRWCA